MPKSSLTLMKHLFRKSSQISDYASRHGQTIIEVEPPVAKIDSESVGYAIEARLFGYTY